MKKINLLILIGFIMSCTQIPQTEPDWYNKTPFNDNMYYGVGVGESKIQALVGSLIDIQRINAIKLSSKLRFDSTSLGTSRFDSWMSSSEVIIHPNITLM